MNDKISIHPIHNELQKKIVDLILPIQQIEFNVPITLEGQPDLMDIDQYYHATGGNFWGAELNGELVGTVALMSLGHKAGALRKMFVKKEYRGKSSGVAQELLNALITYCGEVGITDVYLGTIDKLKAALRFYEKNGFYLLEGNAVPDYFPKMIPDDVFYHLAINQKTL